MAKIKGNYKIFQRRHQIRGTSSSRLMKAISKFSATSWLGGNIVLEITS